MTKDQLDDSVYDFIAKFAFDADRQLVNADGVPINDSAFTVDEGRHLVPQKIADGENHPFLEAAPDGYLVTKADASALSSPGNSALEVDAAGYLVSRSGMALAGVPECEIYKGYQNLVNLPPNPDYIVFTDIGDEGVERGMEIFRFDHAIQADGVLTIANLRRYTYQIASVGKASRKRINRLVAVFNSSKGAEFFRSLTFDKYGGAGTVRAGGVVDTTQTDGTTDYAVSYSADFVIVARIEVSIPQDWADRIDPRLRLVAVK